MIGVALLRDLVLKLGPQAYLYDRGHVDVVEGRKRCCCVLRLL